MAEPPSGTVTLLFTDIEGSTKLLQRTGEGYPNLLADHNRLVRNALAECRGYEVDTAGDAFFFAFASAREAVAAAVAAQQALAAHEWPEGQRVLVRMGLHTGEPRLIEGNYVGLDVHRAARVMAAGHGGQVLMSQATRDLLPEQSGLRDLGEHRLKDLSQPERLFQFGTDDFPPVRSLNATNLPTQPTSLVGRERELAELTAMVRETRLVTLTGPGGTGKTRLALQTTAELVEEFEDGVVWVPLAALTDPELVITTIASTLGVRETPGQSAVAALQLQLAEKRTLLLLDNFEHVVDAAAELGAMLAACPNLKLLVTSRAPLRLSAEHEYPVLPLPETDAVELFEQRARQFRPSFVSDEAVVEICHRLDGLPLAIELAAARSKLLSPQQILERLGGALTLLVSGPRDLPERQRTLRATIEWSYHLLSDGEQALFARLAVFAGSFDLDAAEAVCAADVDTLASLLEKSLIRQTDHGRLFLLETIREYATERLEASGKAEELRRRHTEHVLVLVNEGAPAGYIAMFEAPKEWLDRLERDRENVRAALAWSRAGAPRVYLELAGKLWPYWHLCSYIAEGRDWLKHAAKMEPADPALRVKVLNGGAILALVTGDLEEVRRLSQEQLTLALGARDRRGAGAAQLNLGNAFSNAGDLVRARECYESVFAAEDAALEAAATSNLGLLALTEGKLDTAKLLTERALSLLRVVGDRAALAPALSNLGLIALEQGRYDDARAHLAETLGICRETGFKEGIAHCLEQLGAVEAQCGEPTRAAVLLGKAEVLREELRYELAPFDSKLHERSVRAIREALDEEAVSRRSAEGRELGIDEAIRFALVEDTPRPEGSAPLLAGASED